MIIKQITDFLLQGVPENFILTIHFKVDVLRKMLLLLVS